MAAVIYRKISVRASAAAAGKLQVEIWGDSPGEQAPTPPETVAYDAKPFCVMRNGQTVDLLDAIRSRRAKEDDLYEIGSILADFILPGAIRGSFLSSLRTVTRRGDRLRLRLVLQVPELKSWPWEYLYLAPAPGIRSPTGFLALQQDVSIVRHEDIAGPEPDTPRGGSYRLVAAFSSPLGQATLDLASDRAAIATALKSPPEGVTVKPCWVEPTTQTSLEAALKRPCDIFHFSGHGYFFEGKGALLLEGPGQQAVSYEAYKLGLLLNEAKTKVAILSACETGGRSSESPFGGVAASLIVAGLAAVVASQFKLRDKNALAVAENLYASLLSGEAIDDGVYQARKRIAQQSKLEDRDWGALVLYLRVEDGVVFPQGPANAGKGTAPRRGPPPLQTPFIGRGGQVEELTKRLAPGTNLFFYGSYGVGKTSLATALFTRAVTDARFSQGHVWRGIGKTGAERAIELLAAEFPGQQISVANGLDAKIDAFKTLLSSFPGMLIGLDEVPDATVARAILEAADGHCSVLMNGTTQLSLNGTADQIAVKPLAADDAQNLFLSLCNLRAAEMDKKDLELVRKICRRMGRLPLGIKLAAFKCAEGGESLATLWLRIKEAASTIPDDEVRRLFQATYDELAPSPLAQRLLVRIASFPALEAPLEALRANEDNVAFFQAKDKLMSLGLVGSAGTDRLSQHPLLDARATARVDPDLVKSEREYAENWIEAYASAHRRDFPALLREQDNMLGLLDVLARAASWDRLTGVLRNLFDYLRVKGLWLEAIEKLDLCLHNEAHLSDANRGWALLLRAILQTLRGHYPEALRDLDRASERFDFDGDDVNYGRTRYRLGVVHILTGDLQSAGQELRKGIDGMAFKPEIAGADLAGAYSRLGAVQAQQGRRSEAQDAFRRALGLAEQIGDLEEQARAYLGAGTMKQTTSPDEALADFDKALSLAIRMGDDLHCASIQHMIGYQHFYADRYDEAHKCFSEALETFRLFGYQRGITKGLLAMGNWALAKQSYTEAKQYYDNALALNRSGGQNGATVYCLYQLAILAHRQGRLADAEQGYKETEQYAQKEKDRVLQAAVLAQLAKLMLEKADPQVAARYAKAAAKLAAVLQDRLTQGVASYTLSLVREALGQDADAHATLIAARDALATIKGLEKDLAAKIEDEIANPKQTVSFSETSGGRKPEIPDIFRPDRTFSIPDRIIGDAIDLTYSDRGPGGGRRDGGGGDNGGFGGGFGSFGGGGIIP